MQQLSPVSLEIKAFPPLSLFLFIYRDWLPLHHRILWILISCLFWADGHTTQIHPVQPAVLLYSSLIRKPNSAEGKTLSHRTTCTMVTRGPMLTIIEGWSLCSEQSRCILSHLESIMKGLYNFPLSSNGFRDLPILRLNRKAGNKQSGISPVIISWKLLLMI